MCHPTFVAIEMGNVFNIYENAIDYVMILIRPFEISIKHITS